LKLAGPRLLFAAMLSACANSAGAAEMLTLYGADPVRIGMTRDQAETALGTKLKLNSEAGGDEAACSTAERGDGKVEYMFHDYRVVRIDVDAGFLTAEGAGVGTTEAQLRKIYGSRAVFSPHPYFDDGHYVKLSFPARNRKIIFEIEHGRVTSFRVGLPGPVDYIEGCA
jgi:hypothetical protein